MVVVELVGDRDVGVVPGVPVRGGGVVVALVAAEEEDGGAPGVEGEEDSQGRSRNSFMLWWRDWAMRSA